MRGELRRRRNGHCLRGADPRQQEHVERLPSASAAPASRPGAIPRPGQELGALPEKQRKNKDVNGDDDRTRPPHPQPGNDELR